MAKCVPDEDLIYSEYNGNTFVLSKKAAYAIMKKEFTYEYGLLFDENTLKSVFQTICDSENFSGIMYIEKFSGPEVIRQYCEERLNLIMKICDIELDIQLMVQNNKGFPRGYNEKIKKITKNIYDVAVLALVKHMIEEAVGYKLEIPAEFRN